VDAKTILREQVKTYERLQARTVALRAYDSGIVPAHAEAVECLIDEPFDRERAMDVYNALCEACNALENTIYCHERERGLEAYADLYDEVFESPDATMEAKALWMQNALLHDPDWQTDMPFDFQRALRHVITQHVDIHP
jgi:hypothetical protein